MGENSRRELLSALADGEAGELEQRRLLKELEDEDVGTWSHWHLARDLMHGHESVPVPSEFAAGVMDRIEPRGRRPAWLAGAARAAVAASVAAATVVGWQFWTTSSSGGAPAVASAPEQATPLARSRAQPAMVAGRADAGSAEPERQQQARAARYVERLMMRHNELTARHARQGVTPDARMVSLEARDER